MKIYILAAFFIFLVFGGASAQGKLKQFPAISRTLIAFIYDNDVWVSPREGGVAVALTDAPGMKAKTMFSPDGRTIAFNGNLEGNSEIYTVAVTGGLPTRLTHLPSGENLTQWTADGKLLFYTNSLSFNNLAMQLFTVPATGGLPTRVGVPYGGEASISADGQWLAYTLNWPVSLMDHWKHYRGGMTHDIWLFNLRTKASKKITDWIGTDTRPMWREHLIYYVSDAGPERRLNIWEYNTKTGLRRQVTRFAEYDVRNPSIGPGGQGQGEIIFQHGADLYLLDLATGKSIPIEVTISEQYREVKPARVDAGKFISAGGLSPSGKRAVVSARGDIWVLPVEGGSPSNLTVTSGVFERDPAWSPDGKWIAYFSDASGEYEMFVTNPEGASQPRQLTRSGAGFKYSPIWSPDSTRIAFIDHTNTIYLHTLDGNETRRIDRDEWSSQPQVKFSPDSAWLVYNKNKAENGRRSIWLYNIESRHANRVTSGMFDDTFPSFDPAGNYLFFISTRNYSAPAFSAGSRNFIYPNEDTLVAIPLRSSVASPLSSRPAGNKGGRVRIGIDLEGFEARGVRLPVEGWELQGLEVTGEGDLAYIQSKLGARRNLNIFDMKSKKERTIAETPSGFVLSSRGNRALIFTGGSLAVTDTSADQTVSKNIPLAGMTVDIDRRAEWRQLFDDTWRLYRDFFYDPNMHRIDWPEMRRRYRKMLNACMTREDVNFVLSEMAGELSVGHAYGGGGDLEQAPRVAVGMLGADFDLHNGAYRITRIYEGAPWDTGARGPLSQPEITVKPGNYLLAVNNTPIDIKKDPWAAFLGLADVDTTITVSDKSVIDSTARRIVVKPVSADVNFRYLAWIESNRAYVNRKTGGRVGYIHIPAFNAQALNQLVTQFYGQKDKDALIIDLRWSQGGSLGDVFAKMLDPRILNYYGGRYSMDTSVPQSAHHGPKCLLVSGMSVSAGENFTYYFRKLGLGKIIGNRTWGGFVGLNGNPALIDGGFYNIPNAPFFEHDGTWMPEGHGIEPDIEVVNDPAKMVTGIEPQLDAAIKQMLNELKVKPFVKARKPTVSRDRRGGPIKPTEK